jgi:carboxypeptidase Q
MASEDPATASREKSVLPANSKTGEPGKWPAQRSPTRKGGMD